MVKYKIIAKENTMKRRPENMWNKVQRFSIRKFSFGVTSALVGTFFLANASMVQASSIEKEAGTQNNHLEISKVTEDLSKENKDEVTKEKTVEKSQLAEVINELTDIFKTVNKDKVSKTSLLQFETALSQAKTVLQNESATQEEVDSHVRSLKSTISIVKSMPKLPASSEEKEKKETVAQKETAEASSSKVQEEVTSPKTQEENNASLKQIQKDLQNYLTTIEGKENTETKVEEAKSILANITKQVENPTLSSEELTVLLKQASQVRNSIVNEVLRENSGARDSRNGKSMGEGTGFRANEQINQGALTNVKYFASVDPRDNGGRKTINDNSEFTRNKTDIKAYYMKDSEGQWIVYDVFFNNDGKKMTRFSYQQEYYFQGPFNIMDLNNDGTYKSNTIKDLSFTRYAPKDPNAGKKLSDGFDAFKPYGNRANISKFWDQNYDIFNADKRTIYDPRSGVYRNNQRWDVFKHNQDDSTLNTLTKNKSGNYPSASYYLGLKVGSASTDYAVHMHAKIKIRDNVTPQEAAQYGRVYAATTTKGDTTQQSYIMGATGSRLQNDPEAPKDPIKGLTVTKTVGDDAGDPINPVSSGYVTHKNGKSFPAGMTWSWQGNSPSTAQAGVFKYTSVATYKDGSKSTDKNSGSDGTVTLNVKPKQPIITTSVVHKKGLPNQQITVNVGNGVPNNSKVNIYDGDRIIGTGTTNGGTATVTITEALPGKPLKAETVVTNANGTVTSDKSNPVTPTEVPDNQPPTLEISPANQTVVEGQTVTFTVTARDDKHVNFDPSDLTTKYSSRLITGNVSATPVTETDTEKTRRITITTTAEDVGKTNTITFKATDNAGHEAKPVTFTFNVTPRDTTPPKIYWLKDDGTRQELGYTHAAGQNVVIPLYRGDAVNTRLITVDDSGKVTDFRLENLQSGFNFTPVSGTATEESPLGQNVTGKVGLEVKKGKYTARAISTDGTNSTTGYFVFDIHEQAEKYPLEGKTETVTVGDSLKTWNGRVDSNQYTEAPKGRGVGVEWGWKGEAPKVVQDTAGVFKYTATATHPDKSVAESNPQVTIIVKPKAPTIETDLTGKAEVPNTEVVVNVHDGVKDGSTVTLYSSEGRAIGTGTVTNGKAKITGTIPVGNITAKTTVQTPGQPNVESELSPIKVATKIAETEKPGKIEITQQPNGNAIVTPKKPDGTTYPSGSRVEIPGENGTTITVTIGDNGSGEVPNDNLPKTNVPGTGTVTEPNKKPSQPVDVTTPARKTPTLDVKRDPETGDVTVTPKKPDGSTYPPGTKVEIPGKDGNPIIVTIDKEGKGKVPNSDLPDVETPGTGKITEPGKPTVEVPNVTTPSKVTPTLDVERDPETGDVTVTPKKPDGSTYPPGTTVEIPGKDGKPITVTIGEDGKGKVPNSDLPDVETSGTGKITEPGKSAVEVPNVTTPAKFTPETPVTEKPGKIEITQQPNGNAIVTPKKPDGSTYPPGTKVEIPGEDGTTITVTIGDNGSGEVPNDKLPKKDIPGKGIVTEPNKKPSKPVDVTTPARKTPTSELEQNPKTNDVTETSKDNQTPAQETPVQQTQDTNQNILPNTGTADGLGIFSAAAASILSGLGLVVFGKKEDEESENN